MMSETTLEEITDTNKILNSIYRNKSYFTRGHNMWTSYFLSIINFITIIYVLMGTQIPILYVWFPNILVFGMVFGITYFVMANLIGRFDIKRGPLAVENTLAFNNNPPFQNLVEKVERLEEKLNIVLELLRSERKE